MITGLYRRNQRKLQSSTAFSESMICIDSIIIDMENTNQEQQG